MFMETTDKPQLLFYQKLGELFYAVAATECAVGDAEYGSLQIIIAEKWKNLHGFQNVCLSQASAQMNIVFEWFDYDHLDANDCYDNFADYLNENPHLFTDERKQLIWETSQTIAAIFAGNKKCEEIMLGKLKALLSIN